MKFIYLTLLLGLIFGTAAWADDQADRQKLFGSWSLEGTADTNTPSAWTFASAKSAMRIIEGDPSGKVADFACGTEGAACEVKTGGKKAMVSIWFNGPRLVELETKGSDVVKRRFKILPGGDSMEMEVIPIVPSGKTETFEFKRAELSARQQ